MKRNSFIIFFLIFITYFSKAQSLEGNYKAHCEGWLVNLEIAYEESSKTGKPILANFTGSDWCGWCHKIKREIFDTREFKTWADSSVVLLEVDFPRKFQLPDNIRQQNQNLQQYFQVTGFPTIWVFDMKKDEEKKQFIVEPLGKTGYKRSVLEFTKDVDRTISKRKK